MTSREFVEKIRSRFAGGPLDIREVLLVARILFYDFAEQAWQFRLADGQRLNDGTDLSHFCKEVAAAIELEEMGQNAATNTAARRLRASGRVFDDTCPRCGHVHQGDRECGEQIGGGRICRCEMEVPV